jgi:hypothetical protein
MAGRGIAWRGSTSTMGSSTTRPTPKIQKQSE